METHIGSTMSFLSENEVDLTFLLGHDSKTENLKSATRSMEDNK